MEAWREELYHHGVKGMKWKKHKWKTNENPQVLKISAFATAFGNIADQNERFVGKDAGAKERVRKARNIANAVTNGRPAPRPRRLTGSYKQGYGLTKRGRVKNSGNTSQLGRDKKKRKKALAKKVILGMVK